MSDVDVLSAIDHLADEHRVTCEKARADREFERDISIAIKFLEPHRFMVVPPGWRLAQPPRRHHSPTSGREAWRSVSVRSPAKRLEADRAADRRA